MEREVAFVVLKSTNQSVIHFLTVSKLAFRRRAAVTGLSTIIYKLVSSGRIYVFDNAIYIDEKT